MKKNSSLASANPHWRGAGGRRSKRKIINLTKVNRLPKNLFLDHFGYRHDGASSDSSSSEENRKFAVDGS